MREKTAISAWLYNVVAFFHSLAFSPSSRHVENCSDNKKGNKNMTENAIKFMTNIWGICHMLRLAKRYKHVGKPVWCFCWLIRGGSTARKYLPYHKYRLVVLVQQTSTWEWEKPASMLLLLRGKRAESVAELFNVQITFVIASASQKAASASLRKYIDFIIVGIWLMASKFKHDLQTIAQHVVKAFLQIIVDCRSECWKTWKHLTERRERNWNWVARRGWIWTIQTIAENHLSKYF